MDVDVDKEFFAESSGCLQLVFFVDKYSIDDKLSLGGSSLIIYLFFFHLSLSHYCRV